MTKSLQKSLLHDFKNLRSEKNQTCMIIFDA